MKNKFICLRINKIYFFIIFLIFIILIGYLCGDWWHNINKVEMNNAGELVENYEENDIEKDEKNIDDNNTLEIADDTEINVTSPNEMVVKDNATDTAKLEEYKTIPREIDGHKVVGKIQIPKIDLEAYILSETNKDTLKVSVTKLYGPGINEVGNFCIAGHNYKKFFGKIKDLELKDNIILTDTYDRSVTYEEYDIFQISPTDTNCLNQDTGGDREVTLITCTKGAIKRIIVKAIEVYD